MSSVPRHNIKVGDRFGRLTVEAVDVKEMLDEKHYRTHILCRCSCDKTKKGSASELLKGQLTSCGCALGERWRKHGFARTRLYRIWKGMRDRCRNSHSYYYVWYGALGIRVCKEWDDFLTFKTWADAHGYSDDLSIDRIDSTGNYCPENCRWATVTEQNRNKRTTPHIEFEGKSMTCAEWAREMKLDDMCLRGRLRAGWSVEDALTIPSGKTRGWRERERATA